MISTLWRESVAIHVPRPSLITFATSIVMMLFEFKVVSVGMLLLGNRNLLPLLNTIVWQRLRKVVEIFGISSIERLAHRPHFHQLDEIVAMERDLRTWAFDTARTMCFHTSGSMMNTMLSMVWRPLNSTLKSGKGPIEIIIIAHRSIRSNLLLFLIFRTHELQVVHIFQPSKTSPARGFASTAKFHPYKPHLVTAEALGSLEEYAVTIWGVHRADKVRRLTLAETMTRIPMDSIITVSAALGEEIKKQRALQERYK